MVSPLALGIRVRFSLNVRQALFLPSRNGITGEATPLGFREPV